MVALVHGVALSASVHAPQKVFVEWGPYMLGNKCLSGGACVLDSSCAGTMALWHAQGPWH